MRSKWAKAVVSSMQPNKGMHLMVLSINPAKRLYEKLGLVTVEETDAGVKGLKCKMSTVMSQAGAVLS
jgi:hypothetical protein